MFIVKKTISGNDYYYLRKSERKDGKVRAVTVAYLGKTKIEAEKKAKGIEKKLSESVRNAKLSDKKIVGERSEFVNKEKDKKSRAEKQGMIGEKKIKKLFTARAVAGITIEELAAFCKRKGFVFRSSDIYGGFAGFWDLGPLGVELFNNIKREWWNYFVRGRDDLVGMEGSIISHPRVWKASGHLDSFTDVAVVCGKCGYATKIDKSELGKVKCERCGGDYKDQGEFNLLFKTNVGALSTEDSYLRGETAQGMFTDFKLVQETSRQKLPFGIAQIGKCFRNEIAPRDFLFRSREFHIAEFEFFIHPEEEKCELLEDKHLNLKIRLLDEETQKKNGEELKEVSIKEMIRKKKLGEWHAYWLAEQVFWFYSIGLEKNKIKIREHMKDELSHYSSATFDIDYEYSFGSKEIAGNADRGVYDLTQHAKESGEKLDILDEKSGRKIIPRVIEPTFGVERIFLALLNSAYQYDSKRDNVVLKIHSKLAPAKAAVFPIIKKPEYEKMAREIVKDLSKDWNVVYDKSGSIGRRYSRNDEIGTPYCITIDEESEKKKDVTIRNRDDTKQIRVKIEKLREVIGKLINGDIKFEEAGGVVETRVK